MYLYVRTGASDPGLLGLRERDEDEGCQGHLWVVTTETALQTQARGSYERPE